MVPTHQPPNRGWCGPALRGPSERPPVRVLGGWQGVPSTIEICYDCVRTVDVGMEGRNGYENQIDGC